MRFFEVLFFGIVSFLATCRCDAPQHLRQPPIEQKNPNQDPDGRRQWGNIYKRFEVRKRAENDDQPEYAYDPVEKGKDLESVILSIDTGATPDRYEENRGLNAFDTIKNAFFQLGQSPNNPIHRARDEYNIRPKLIKVRADANPSLKVDVDSTSILHALNDLLSSPTVRRYTDVVARKAADLYTSFRDELIYEGRRRND